MRRFIDIDHVKCFLFSLSKLLCLSFPILKVYLGTVLEAQGATDCPFQRLFLSLPPWPPPVWCHLAANGLIHQGERVKPALDSTGTTTAVKYRALHRQERHTPLASFVAAAARRQPECTFPRNSRIVKIRSSALHSCSLGIVRAKRAVSTFRKFPGN